ncbi:hypothetical protein F5Y09DRAFT_342556 [Xylaria sp. FL1042]|nr:hypothetical protein F5Y09DRAFT_342556 [Xylaria sp. FL1042]
MQFTAITLSLVALATGVFAAPQALPAPNVTLAEGVVNTAEPAGFPTSFLPPGFHLPNGTFPPEMPHGAPQGPPHGPPCGHPIPAIPVPHAAAPSLMASTGALAVGVAAAVALSM